MQRGTGGPATAEGSGSARPGPRTGLALRDSGLGIRDVCALARAAEDAGYTSIWFPEVGSRDAVLLAALAGQSTSRVVVGTGVIPVFSRNVVMLAMAAAAASEASAGRFVLGLGAGHQYTAEAWFDQHWHAPRARLRETVETVRRILSGERVSADGAVRVGDFHLGTRPPRVPVYLAALTPGSLRLAGDVADGAILNFLPPEGMDRASLLVKEAAADGSRTVRTVGYVRAAVADEGQAAHDAMEAVREHAYMYVRLPAYARSIRAAGLGAHLDRLDRGDERALGSLVDAMCACGTAETVRNRLAAFREAVDEVVVYPVPFGDDPAASVLHTLRACI